MKSSRGFYLISLVIHATAILANRLGGANGFGSSGNNNHHFGGSNQIRPADSHGNAASGSKDANSGLGNNNHNQHGSIGSHNQGQSSGNRLHDVDSIVSAIHSANQQVHAVSRAIRSVRGGGTIKHLDLAFQSLASAIKVTSTSINSARSLHDGDFQSIQSAMQPFHQSIGSLVTQLVGRRDTIARLCGCRSVQGALNHLRLSTRAMFDGIKTHLDHGGSSHGRHGFNGFHPLDSGIESFLNHGYNAFGFGNCIDFGNTPSQTSTSYTTQTSTWAPSTVTDYTTVVVTNTITETITDTQWGDAYSTFTSTYSSYSSGSPTYHYKGTQPDFIIIPNPSLKTGSTSYNTGGGGYQATDTPSDSSSFGYGEDSGSSNIYGSVTTGTAAPQPPIRGQLAQS
ncbi:hypothetical protein F5Y11DRAFT_347544 [Daldinia sp. FL1419]|nr:hypothetical protein F5Y11DRAFT_347544 [Daldinia sp. FL1419]